MGDNLDKQTIRRIEDILGQRHIPLRRRYNSLVGGGNILHKKLKRKKNARLVRDNDKMALKGLKIIETADDGDCFFDSIYQAMVQWKRIRTWHSVPFFLNDRQFNPRVKTWKRGQEVRYNSTTLGRDVTARIAWAEDAEGEQTSVDIEYDGEEEDELRERTLDIMEELSKDTPELDFNPQNPGNGGTVDGTIFACRPVHRVVQIANGVVTVQREEGEEPVELPTDDLIVDMDSDTFVRALRKRVSDVISPAFLETSKMLYEIAKNTFKQKLQTLQNKKVNKKRKTNTVTLKSEYEEVYDEFIAEGGWMKDVMCDNEDDDEYFNFQVYAGDYLRNWRDKHKKTKAPKQNKQKIEHVDDNEENDLKYIHVTYSSEEPEWDEEESDEKSDEEEAESDEESDEEGAESDEEEEESNEEENTKYYNDTIDPVTGKDPDGDKKIDIPEQLNIGDVVQYTRSNGNIVDATIEWVPRPPGSLERLKNYVQLKRYWADNQTLALMRNIFPTIDFRILVDQGRNALYFNTQFDAQGPKDARIVLFLSGQHYELLSYSHVHLFTPEETFPIVS